MAQEYSLAAGFNNVVGLVVIENTTVSGVKFVSIQGVGTYDPGEEVVKLSGLHDDVGEGVFEWLFTRLTFPQRAYLTSTFLAGLRSNKVTARTRLDDLTYHNVNAVLTIPKSKGQSRTFNFYTDVVLTFNIDEILS